MSRKSLSFDSFTESIAGLEIFKRDLVGNSKEHKKMIELLKKVVEGELTDRQKTCISLYYGGKMRMNEIARTLEIDVSCVSRHIKKGKERIQKTMKYYFPL